MADADEKTAKIMSVYAAFREGDVDNVMSHMYPDIGWNLDKPGGYTIEMLRPRTGISEVRNFFEWMKEDLDFTTFNVKQVYVGQDNTAVAWVHVAYTNKKLNKKYEDPYEFHLWTFPANDDYRNVKLGLRVTSFTHLIDTHSALLAAAED